MKRLLIAVMMILATGVARADNALIDFQGYSFETGGFLPSNSGDVLSIAGIVDAMDPRFGVNLTLDEVTLWVTDLLSTGQVDIGDGFLSIQYDGGIIELWQDPSRNHDYGTYPPNATAPPTFVDGTLFLSGTLSNFFLYFDTVSGAGAYEGTAFFTAGSGLATLNQLHADAYTFGGVLSRTAIGPGNIPDGYDLQVDGLIEVEVIIGVEPKSWGAVKSLYSR